MDILICLAFCLYCVADLAVQHIRRRKHDDD